MRVIVNSVPKSGTHLVEKALRLLGVSGGSPLLLSSATTAGLEPIGDEPTVKVGVGMPVSVSATRLRARLAALRPGQVITSHLAWSQALQELLQDAGVRMLLVVRDPRDVAVSLAHHIAKEKQHRLHKQFLAMSDEDRVLSAIRGVRCDGEVLLEAIGRRFESVAPWQQWPEAMLVRFEDIIGPPGGGDAQSQLQTLEAICTHLACPADRLQEVATRLFGGSATFRQGTTGQWRDLFTPAHQAAFDEVAPGLLATFGYA